MTLAAHLDAAQDATLVDKLTELDRRGKALLAEVEAFQRDIEDDIARQDRWLRCWQVQAEWRAERLEEKR